MTVTESIGMTWVIFSTGCFTAFALISLIWVILIGSRKVLGWIEIGRKSEERMNQSEEFHRIINS